MKNFRLFAALLLLLAATVSCGKKIVVNGHVEGAEGGIVTAGHFGDGSISLTDTVKLSRRGDFRYVTRTGGSGPEFIYLFRGDRKIASLLLDEGDRVTLSCDTLGNCTLQGSGESVRLQETEKEYASFLQTLDTVSSLQAYQREYVRYYRKCVRYVLDNPSSLTVLPVLFQKFSSNLPVFSQNADALIFRRAYDSLSRAYPQSRYLPMLEREVVSREQAFKIRTMMEDREAVGFPDIELPDYGGEMRKLSDVSAKAVLIYFWDAGAYSHKEFVQSALKPLYAKFSPKGLQIYSVCVTADKARWASVVKAQELPWINVNDGQGRQSPALRLYNVTKLPQCVLIVDGTVKEKFNADYRLLEEELTSCLR